MKTSLGKAKKSGTKGIAGKTITVGTATKYSKVKFDPAHIIALYKSGKPVSQIAEAIGYPKNTGHNRTRRVLVAAGIYGRTA